MPVSRFLIVTIALMLAFVPTVLAGSKKSDQSDDLEQRIAALEKKIDEQQAAIERLLAERFDALSKQLDGKFTTLEQKIAEATRSEADKDREAGVLLGQISRHMQNGEFDLAQGKMKQLQTKYAGTNTARRAMSIQRELAVFGKAAPSDFGIEQWYQGNADLDGDDPTLLVFWEIWCPHCKREVPKLQALHDKYKERGLQVVGLTRLTKSATEDGVRSFIEEQNVSYPIAKENGTASSYFNVSGIPAAAVIKDGKIVWRGHPARLTENMLEGWL